ncbi:MAG TPA: helix-hairpin-helix domain-containing protein [Verrucomicrobiae bacterium]|nr:helix-hairpin-helix domain-containing protein [Verrucomicrobiae bacterium]
MCGSQLARETELGRDWHCPNPDCPPQILKRVALWASPEAMDIQGCDAGVIAQLVNKGLVRDGAEFYRLRLGEIATLEGVTKDRAQQIFDSITASMKREAWRVLFGLGIPNLGAAQAQALCKHFASLDALFAVGRERLAKLDGVTDVMARSLTHWYGDSVNRKLVKRLMKLGVNFTIREPTSAK